MAQPDFVGGDAELSRSFVAPEHVFRPVGGVVIGTRHRREQPAGDVAAGVKIEIAVTVGVGGGDRIDFVVAGAAYARGFETAVAGVPAQRHVHAEGNREVLPAVVVEVRDQGAARLVEKVDAHARGDFLGSAAVARQPQAVRESGLLAEVKVVTPVAVHVADRKPLGAEKGATEQLVHARSPGLGAGQDLRGPVGGRGEHLLRVIGQQAGGAEHFFILNQFNAGER